VQLSLLRGDLNDGLSRAEEAPKLRALGRSITEPAVQRVYRDCVSAVVRKLQPDYIGLAAETNLIRAAAPASLYAAVVQKANAAAGDLPHIGRHRTAVRQRAGGNGVGRLHADAIRRRRHRSARLRVHADARFVLVSLLRLRAARRHPVRLLQPAAGRAHAAGDVVEGGWTSASVGSVSSSRDKQARYITRHAQLLDSIGARGLIQLVFADPDLATFPQPRPANLPLFTSIGLTDSDLIAKPALANWDVLFARRLTS